MYVVVGIAIRLVENVIGVKAAYLLLGPIFMHLVLACE